MSEEKLACCNTFPVIKRKFLNTFVCAYYASCFAAIPELKISVCVLSLDYGLIKFYFA